MKQRLTQVFVTLTLIVSLAMSLVVEFHHHDADGSMCLGFSCHTDCHHHESDQPCDGEDCGAHIDNFCCDGHHHNVTVPAPDHHAILTLSVSVPEIAETAFAGYGSVYRERRVPRPLMESKPMRAPPVDIYA